VRILDKNDIKHAILYQIKASGLPAPELEHIFHDTRKWRFDYAWPDRMLALEYEGGVYTKGRHNRPRGYTGDCEKYTIAGLMGWTIIRATVDHVKSGMLLAWLEMAQDKERGHG